MNASALQTADELNTLRHDSAHLPAQAVKELYPVTQVAIGLAIENRFYYDFVFAEPLSAALPLIEQRMPDIVVRGERVMAISKPLPAVPSSLNSIASGD